MYSAKQLKRAETLLAKCREEGVMIVTAESCTGGLIASLLTEVSGSSAVVDRGFVTYSNEAKHEMLGVPRVLIEMHGAVSEAAARAMAKGALDHSNAQLSVAVTGIAGPGGGSKEKPVGTVHLACAFEDKETQHFLECFDGDRNAVRMQTVEKAVSMMMGMITS